MCAKGNHTERSGNPKYAVRYESSKSNQEKQRNDSKENRQNSDNTNNENSVSRKTARTTKTGHYPQTKQNHNDSQYKATMTKTKTEEDSDPSDSIIRDTNYNETKRTIR